MSEKKRHEDLSEKYIKWLPELSKASGSVAGGKGANLAEMYNSGFPVPPAFVVTAQAFEAYLKSAGLKEQIAEIIKNTEVENTQELEDNAKKIRELIINTDMPQDMQKEITEAYSIFSTSDNSNVLGPAKEQVFVAVRSSATTEDLSSASFAGQQETYTNIKGDKQLITAVKKCFASLYTARAVYYRHKKGFEKANALLAVVVQKMVNSEKSGVIFTRNPTTQKEEVIIEAVFGLGEGIVSGKIVPDQHILSRNGEIKSAKIATKKIAIIKTKDGTEKTITLPEAKSKEQVLTPAELSELCSLAVKIDEHYKKPQDIEFAVDSKKVYIVQSRPITTFEVKKKVMNVEGEIILTGQGASPGVVSGKVRIINTMEDLVKIKEGDVLVTKMTNPDMVVSMQKSAAIITDEGGITAHASIVSREMGIPCVVGTEKATKVLKDGMMVTVDGTNGHIHEGASGGLGTGTGAISKKEVLPIIKGTKTKIKVMVDLPDFAERAAKSEADAVGLLRLEGIIAECGKHPLYFIKENNTSEYSKIIEKGVEEIARHFKEVWVRTSDIRSDEFKNLLGAPKEIEVNPMLGMHGIRFSLKHLPILEAELDAIKNVASKHKEKIFGIMFPQVISEQEVEQVFKLIRNKYNLSNIKMGVMVETPAAVQIIRNICKYVKFISFGTNDLTQFTLAIDRGNAEVQYLYNELHPAILAQLKKVIDICKEYKVETSICGQAGSNKEMAEHLVTYGIDSLSVNADMAHDMSIFVQELEHKLGRTPNTNNNNTQQKKQEHQNNHQNNQQHQNNNQNHNNSSEKKQEEFPDIEIGFDVFKAQ